MGLHVSSYSSHCSSVITLWALVLRIVTVVSEYMVSHCIWLHAGVSATLLFALLNHILMFLHNMMTQMGLSDKCLWALVTKVVKGHTIEHLPWVRTAFCFPPHVDHFVHLDMVT